jgi:hypothetical protein
MPPTSIWKTITEDETRRKRGLPPMHPGELQREEILPALDRAQDGNRQAARRVASDAL